MSVIVDGPRGVYLGCQAMLLEDDRELAWAEQHVIRNPAIKYVLGKFVEADNANDNGHLFRGSELRDAQSAISYSPLNMLHRAHHVVGAFVATEMVYPVQDKVGRPNAVAASFAAGQASAFDVRSHNTAGLTAAGDDLLHPYVEALAAFWRYYFPDEYRAVEEAHAQGALYYSMECVPEQFECVEAGCGKTFDYVGRTSPDYCDHLNAAGATKVCRTPHFTGGALIIPPVRPGWKRADISELSSLIEKNVAEAEAIYNGISKDLPHLTPREWEAMMAQVMGQVHARDFSAEQRRKLAKENKAMPDGSFPIENAGDVKNAIKLAHTPAQRAHVKKRAKALGCSDLIPESWT